MHLVLRISQESDFLSSQGQLGAAPQVLATKSDLHKPQQDLTTDSNNKYLSANTLFLLSVKIHVLK